MLTVSEELFLLSLNEKRHSVRLSNSMAFPYALVGAMIFDLIFDGRIRIEDGEKIALINPTPVVNEAANILLAGIQARPQPKKLIYWINVFGSRGKKLQKVLTKSLLEKGIIKEEEKHYLWVIPYTEYTQMDASAKFWSKHLLRTVVLDGGKIEERSVALLSLMKACNKLDHIFTRDEIKSSERRVDELINNENIGRVVTEVMDEIYAATSSAIVAASSV